MREGRTPPSRRAELGSFIDETGNKYGRLTVIRRGDNAQDGRTRWICRCECGTICIVVAGNLRRGNTRSCGCLQRDRTKGRNLKNEIGKRYGRGVVIARKLPNGSGNGARWMLRCDCGNRYVALGRDLRTGHVQSCGCLARETAKANIARAIEANRKPRGMSAFRDAIYAYKRNARLRGIAWELDDAQFALLVVQPCIYCGAALQNIIGKDANGEFRYTGLDRVNSASGYVPGNVVPCCKDCNQAKMGMRLHEFAEWASRISGANAGDLYRKWAEEVRWWAHQLVADYWYESERRNDGELHADGGYGADLRSQEREGNRSVARVVGRQL